MSSKKLKRETIPQKAHRALKHAVRDLVKERKAANQNLVIWKNNRVVSISAKNI